MTEKVNILGGRQSIPELTHIYNFNTQYTRNGDVYYRIEGYSFGNLPRQYPDQIEYTVWIECEDSDSSFKISSVDVDGFDYNVEPDDELTELFPSFNAFKTHFTIVSENHMDVYIPPIFEDCEFDIIIRNVAGYSRVSDLIGYKLQTNISEFGTDINLNNVLDVAGLQ